MRFFESIPMSQVPSIFDSAVFSELVAPLEPIILNNPFSRVCADVSDREWTYLGLQRVLSEEKSGRGFLQRLFHSRDREIGTSLFFEGLKSERRLRFVRHTLEKLTQIVKVERKEFDPFAAYDDLEKFDLYAGDGHYHKASAHEVPIDGVKYATQHFYTLNLRTHDLNHLCLAEYGPDRKKEHDMRALKRTSADTLRQQAPIGRKVLYVWDRAGLDFSQWSEWKSRHGIYFLSRSKENLILQHKEILVHEPHDPVNQGVLSDELVQTSCGTELRRIIYRCPLSSTTFSFLTNLPKKVRPGLIAFLYKIRWDLEKAFDQIKNKLLEQKAWAKSEEAKNMQALFLCLAHNLLLLFEDRLRIKEGIVYTRDIERRQKRLEFDLQNTKVKAERVSEMLKTIQRVTQRPFALLRWIRAHLFVACPWGASIERLRAAYLRFG